MRVAAAIVVLCFLASTGSGAEPGGSKADSKAARKGSALAEKRAAAAAKKTADMAKRTFTKFDANRDGKLDAGEWAKAQGAVDKTVESDVLKAAGKRRAAVKAALAELNKPDVARDDGDAVTPEAFESYVKSLLDESNTIAKNAPEAPAAAAAEGAAERKTAAQRRREELERRARGDDRPTASERNQERRRSAEEARQRTAEEEAVRRATGGRLDPNRVPAEIREGIGRPGAGDAGRPIRPEATRPNRPQKPDGTSRPNRPGDRPGSRPGGR